MTRLRHLITSQSLILTLAGVLLVVAGILVAVLWSTPQGSTAQPVRDAIFIFMTTIGGLLISFGASGWLTTRSMMDAVTATMGQNPEFVRDYFKPEVIEGLLQNNLLARTQDAQFSAAVVKDLLGAFIKDDSSRIRTNQTYEVRLIHAEIQTGMRPDTAAPKTQTVWVCKETLRFDERPPPRITHDTTIAVLVFCTSALDKWFNPAHNCLYRSVAWLPPILNVDEDARGRWVEDHLTCEIRLGDDALTLRREQDTLGSAKENWEVRFVVETPQEEIEAMLDSARRDQRSNFDQVRVLLKSKMTLDPSRHSYTAILAYPTRDPMIDFRIEGPADDLECSTFYNLGSWNEAVDTVDEEPNLKHVRVELRGERWVFPTSGAVFSWVTCDDGQSTKCPSPNAHD